MWWQAGLGFLLGDGNKSLDPTNIGLAEVTILIMRVINLLTQLIGVIVFIYLLIAGVQYITAAGNDSKQAEAKKTITASIIGLVIVFLAAGATATLLRVLKFDANMVNNQTGIQTNLDDGVKNILAP